MKRETQIFDLPEQTAEAVADLIRETALSRQQQGKHFNLAVSGGSTPRQLFQLLADEEYRNTIPWETVRFFWVDERCVPPTQAESNFGMTWDALLQYAFVPAENVFRIKGEEVPEDEVQRYGKLLIAKLPSRNGHPVFDLILLGMGDDGHTASIFPDQMYLLEVDHPAAIAVHPVSGQKRITLTGPTICNADKVAFLINGQSKADLLREIINDEPSAQNYPAAHVYGHRRHIAFYLDKAAASAL